MVVLAFCFVVGLVAYIVSQEPRVWCDRQWCGISLIKGGYRSWHLSFCDGFIWRDGKMVPFVIAENRVGYFRWPKYGHADVRALR